MTLLVGIFVGGAGSRMGGVAKGLLEAPDTKEPLVLRLSRTCRDALGEAEIVLVGESAAYGSLGFRVLPDDPPGSGPLSGLRALLREGSKTNRDVLALACDLPFVTAELVKRLSSHAPESLAVAPRNSESGFWEPLFARYSSACAGAADTEFARGRRSLKSVLEALGDRAAALPVSGAEWRALRDWDTQEDREAT